MQGSFLVQQTESKAVHTKTFQPMLKHFKNNLDINHESVQFPEESHCRDDSGLQYLRRHMY